MQVQNNQLTFQSKIKFIESGLFKEKIKNLNPKTHEVGYPWDANTMKRGKNLYTTEIMDCISGGIIDGSDVTMFHMCTYNQEQAKRKHQKGFDIESFERRLLEKINLDNQNLHGIILGGFQLKENRKYNVNKLNKIKKVFEDNNIPYSIFGARRDVHYFGRYSILYSNKEDTWYITNNLTVPYIRCGKPYSEINLLSDNKIEYTLYKQDPEFGYKSTRIISNLFDFFKSQFRQVQLSDLDEIA